MSAFSVFYQKRSASLSELRIDKGRHVKSRPVHPEDQNRGNGGQIHRPAEGKLLRGDDPAHRLPSLIDDIHGCHQQDQEEEQAEIPLVDSQRKKTPVKKDPRVPFGEGRAQEAENRPRIRGDVAVAADREL